MGFSGLAVKGISRVGIKRRSFRSNFTRIVAMVMLVCLVFSLSSCSCAKSEVDEPARSVQGSLSAPALEMPKSTWPLTGETINEGDDPNRRPLSVKIENTPVARPQLGLSHADVVYESITEGGITRFNCIFQSDIPVELGPVRSARNSDVSIVPQYQALFFYAGSNSTVKSEIAAAGIDNMSYVPAAELYHRVDYREAPHNLYLYTEQSYVVAESLGYNIKVDTPSTLVFGDTDIAAAAVANSITVPLSDYYIAGWSYDAGQGFYLRAMDEPTLDAEASQQICADNVVVLWATHELGVIANNSQTLNIDLTTGGNASIFRDGKRIDGTWEATSDTPPRFKDAAGNEIKLSSGKTWFEVVDISVVVSSS